MNFDKHVFINCPFDKEYIDNLLKPIIFFLVKNDLIPRLAIEISDSGQIRLEKITDIIRQCKYSIHDLSIVKSKKAKEYARMNMPFELGIDYGMRKIGKERLSEKQFLILESTKYDYMKALSDINGLDVKVHKNSTETVFECLYTWSSETLKLTKQIPPLKSYYNFIDFNAKLFEEKLNEFDLDEVIAKNYIENLSIREYIEEIKERK